MELHQVILVGQCNECFYYFRPHQVDNDSYKSSKALSCLASTTTIGEEADLFQFEQQLYLPQEALSVNVNNAIRFLSKAFCSLLILVLMPRDVLHETDISTTYFHKWGYLIQHCPLASKQH